jgi:hypothetical protein
VVALVWVGCRKGRAQGLSIYRGFGDYSLLAAYEVNGDFVCLYIAC